MHLRLPWAFHFHETVGVPPSPWSCVSLLIHSRFPSSSITICSHADEQQGLVVQVQNKTYQSPACQEVADKPSYSKWSWQVGLQSHLELGVGVVNLLSLLLLSFWCGCAVQGALQFSWNFQPSATGALTAGEDRASLFLPELITSCLPYVVSLHLVLQWLQTHLLCSWAFRISSVQSPGEDAISGLSSLTLSSLLDSHSSAYWQLFLRQHLPSVGNATTYACASPQERSQALLAAWDLSQLLKLSGSIWYTKGIFFSGCWRRASCSLWTFLCAIAQLQRSFCPPFCELCSRPGSCVGCLWYQWNGFFTLPS